VAGFEDVRRFALLLPESSERSSRGRAQWRVREKLFVWERPLRASEVRQLGGHAPEGPILGVRVESLGVKEALIAGDPEVFFTTPHFDGYPAVLVLLERIARDELEELVVEAWLARAPKRLAQKYIDEHLPPASR
jgi:hypothetical protein